MYQVGGTMSTRTDGNYFVSYIIRKADKIKFSDKVVGSPYINARYPFRRYLVQWTIPSLLSRW